MGFSSKQKDEKAENLFLIFEMRFIEQIHVLFCDVLLIIFRTLFFPRNLKLFTMIQWIFCM